MRIGRNYTVRCAKIKRYLPTWLRDQSGHTYEIFYVPIIGPVHADKSFSKGQKHYHVDCRFDSEYSDTSTITRTIVQLDQRPDRRSDMVVGYRNRRLRCVREVTGLDIPGEFDGPYPKKYHEWARSMKGKSCAGKKCPHYGTDMHIVNGKYFCPLHGLIGCMETEKIIGYGPPPV